MLWKKYIGSPVGISSLSREKLEDYIQSTQDSLQKMQNQEAALKSEINDITIEINHQLSCSKDMQMIDYFGDEVRPSNYSASERRVHQLRATIAQMESDKDQLDQEIATKQDIIHRYSLKYTPEQKPPKASLLVGPFNNTDLRRIFNYLTNLSERTKDSDEKDEFHFCLDILSGESKLLARRLEQFHKSFNKKCIEQQDDLNELIIDGKKSNKAVDKLREQIEAILKHSDNYQPVLPSTKKDLLQDLSSLGDTTTRLETISNEVNELKKQKKSLKEECKQIGSELILQPIETERDSDVLESISIRQKKLELELEQHSLEEKNSNLHSTIKTLKEEIIDCDQHVKNLSKQSESLKKVMTLNKSKFDQLQTAKVSQNDIELIMSLSKKNTPEEMERQIDQLTERIKLIQKKNMNAEKRIQQSKAQKQQYEPQISTLQKLLDAANITHEDERI